MNYESLRRQTWLHSQSSHDRQVFKHTLVDIGCVVSALNSLCTSVNQTITVVQKSPLLAKHARRPSITYLESGFKHKSIRGETLEQTSALSRTRSWTIKRRRVTRRVSDVSSPSSLCIVRWLFPRLSLCSSSWSAACNGANLEPFVRATGVLSITISVQQE